jgi:hypothetical protein
MTDEPMDDERPVPAAHGDPSPGRTTELLVSQRPVPMVARRRPVCDVSWLRSRLPELRRHPAAVASVSAVATVGTALLVNVLRQALQPALASRRERAGAIAIVGYSMHEVHVFHHAVHHVTRPRAD